MIVVEYPEPNFRVQEKEGKKYLFDALRKNWLLLTPEEWVRQNFVQYLVQVKKYPAAMIALEKELLLNGLKKRFDVLIYDSAHQPWMLVECKAEAVGLQPATLQQALRYNLVLPVPYIVITNGAETRAWQKKAAGMEELHMLPDWPTP